MDERPIHPTAEEDKSARTVAATTGGSPGPDLKDEESSAMTSAWSLDVTQGSPEMSLKGELRPKLVPHRSKLVIPQRVLRPADGDPQLPADYELLKMLGEGGMGVVYAARQASIDRTVAVKMLSSDGTADESQQGSRSRVEGDKRAGGIELRSYFPARRSIRPKHAANLTLSRAV